MPKPHVGGPLLDWSEVAQSMVNDLSTYWPKLDTRHLWRFAKLVCSPLSLKIDSRYVQLVKAWRFLLCTNYTSSVLLREVILPLDLLVPASQPNTWTLRPGAGRLVAITNRAILLCYKVRFPTPQSDWNDFIKRMRTSGHPTATPDQYSVLRNELAFLRVPCNWSELIGRNGPGAVASGQKGPLKWFFHDLPASVPLDFYRLNYTHLIEDPKFARTSYGVTRALQVPKDARGPRFISCEPLEYLHAQFALKDCLYRQASARWREYMSIEDSDRHCRYLENIEYITIDLKDASDMLSRGVVWRAFPEPVRAMLFQCRSTFVSVNGQLHPLRCFSPMGCALTFDIMTYVLIAIVLSCAFSRIYGFDAFGDDLIVHYRVRDQVLATLKEFGFKVNMAKTTSLSSRFRESCGQEWYWDSPSATSPAEDLSAGWERINIRPVYLRDVTNNRPAALACSDVAEKLRDVGLPAVADTIDACVTRSLGFDPRARAVRWNNALQRFEVKVLKMYDLDDEEELDGYPGLYRWFATKSKTKTISYGSLRQVARWTWIDIHDTVVGRFRTTSAKVYNPSHGSVGDVKVPLEPDLLATGVAPFEYGPRIIAANRELR